MNTTDCTTLLSDLCLLFAGAGFDGTVGYPIRAMAARIFSSLYPLVRSYAH